MTHPTPSDSERASFEAWMQRDNPKYRPTDDGIQTRRDWAVWQAARASLPAPTGWQPSDEERERASFELDPLEKAIDAYVEDYETCYDSYTYTPGEEERFRIKDAIMGLLADSEWDRLWGEHIESLVAARTAPTGWKLVPSEPTEEMVVMGFESCPDQFFSPPELWDQYKAMSGCQQAAFRAKLCWAAMLSAAPSQDEGKTK